MRIETKSIIFAAIFISALFLCYPSLGDIIYFKNGGTVEGVVKEENATSIIIDLGVGTMTVRKDEVENVERASYEENARLEANRLNEEISRGEWAPLGCEEIRLAYINAKETKESLRKQKSRSIASKEEISQKEEMIASLLKMLDKKSKELKMIDADKRIKEYNAVVAEINSLSADLNKGNSALKGLYSEEKEINAALMQKANKYRTVFQELKDLLAKKGNVESGYEISNEELAFLEEMNEKLREMESDFKKDIVNYAAEDNQIIVDALINDITLARLVVDTGASIIVISKNVGARLGITDEAIDADIEIIMANGTSVSAKPVTLKSVKVGNAEVRNVQAAILEGNVIGGADGLLGMSFLSSFVVSVDTAAKKLILEEVLETY